MPCSIEGCKRGVSDRGKCLVHLEREKHVGTADPEQRALDALLDEKQQHAVETYLWRRSMWGW